MGFTLRFILGLLLILQVCTLNDGSIIRNVRETSNLTASRDVDVTEKNILDLEFGKKVETKNVNKLNTLESKPKTDTIVNNVNTSDTYNNRNILNDLEQSNKNFSSAKLEISEPYVKRALSVEVPNENEEKDNNKSKDNLIKVENTENKEFNRGDKGRSIDVDINKYISPEFHNINNVYTLPTSDTEKYVNSELDIITKTPTVINQTKNSIDFQSELTTPKTEYFDNKYKAAVDSVDQTLEHIDFKDFDNSKNDASIEKLIDKTKDLEKNSSLDYVKFKNILINNDVNKTSKQSDLMVEEGKKINFESSFNKTEVINTPSDKANKIISNEQIKETQTKGDVEKIETTTSKSYILTPRKSVTLTKPPSNRNNSHILSNKIETDIIKEINSKSSLLPSTVPTSETIKEKGETKTLYRSSTNVYPIDITKRGSIKFADTTTPLPTTTYKDKLIDEIKLNKTLEQIVQENQVISVHVTAPDNSDQVVTDSTTIEAIIKPVTTTRETTVEKVELNTTPVELVTKIVTTSTPDVLNDQDFITTTVETTSDLITSTLPVEIVNTTTEVIDSWTDELTTVNVGTTGTENLTTLSDNKTFSEDETTESISTTENPTTEVVTESSINTVTESSGLNAVTENATVSVNNVTVTNFEAITIVVNNSTESSIVNMENITEPTIIFNVTENSIVVTETDVNNSTEKITMAVETTTQDIKFRLASESDSSNQIVNQTTTTPLTTIVNIINKFSATDPSIVFVNETTTTTSTKSPISEDTDYLDPDDSTVPSDETHSTSTEIIFVHIEKVNNHTTLLPELINNGYNYPDIVIPEEKSVSENTTFSDQVTSEMTEPSVIDNPGKGTIAAIVISSVGAACLILLAGLLFIMRKRQKRITYGQRCTPVSLDDYSMDNVSAYNSVRRKGAARASKRSYGNPAFDDPVAVSHPLNFPALANFANNLEDIKAEFDEIPQITTRTSELPEGCETKNRYANVIPLPETRVYLNHIDGYPNSDYINANYVTGPKNVKGYYIACQGPMQNTVDDFWRMVWEQQSKVILMLTQLFENGVEKCTDYLPPSEVLDCHRLFGDFQVTLKKREVKEKYIISNLQLKNMVSNSWREVTHFWYIGWPDKGVPKEANSIIAFLIEARSYMKSSTLDKKNGVNGVGNGSTNVDVNPVVVHCNPGTGRTGVVIACDIAIREFEKTRLVDIPKIVYRIRRDRASSVQTREQYEFIYKVVSLYGTKLTGGALDSI